MPSAVLRGFLGDPVAGAGDDNGLHVVVGELHRGTDSSPVLYSPPLST